MNERADDPGSIHGDQTARRLGYRGGAIAGPVHLDLVEPLLVDVFGTEWFERGLVSLVFRTPAVEGDHVRAVIRAADERRAGDRTWANSHVTVSVETSDGVVIGDGAAALGMTSIIAEFATSNGRARGEGLRILRGVDEDLATPGVEAVLESSAQRDPTAPDVTDPATMQATLDGAASCRVSLGFLYQHGARAIYGAAPAAKSAVPIIGAAEVRHIAGPLRIGRPYRLTSSVLAVGDSPKTEYVWYESRAEALDDGRLVASLVLQLRWFKATSPLYTDNQNSREEPNDEQP